MVEACAPERVGELLGSDQLKGQAGRKRTGGRHFRSRQVAPNRRASTSSDMTASILPWRFITASSASASPGACETFRTKPKSRRGAHTFHHSSPHTSSNALNCRLRKSAVPKCPATVWLRFCDGLFGPSARSQQGSCEDEGTDRRRRPVGPAVGEAW